MDSIYMRVNDWNMYGQGSWKALNTQVREIVTPELTSSDHSITKKETKEDTSLAKHNITHSENKKYGLYGSLNRRFRIKQKTRKSPKEISQIKEEEFYQSGQSKEGKDTGEVVER